MNDLDTRIQKALQAASEFPDEIPEPTLAEEILDTISGRHQWLMILSLVKAALSTALFFFCCYQFFQQETVMGMIAYASVAVALIVVYCCILLFLWVQMNHNTTIREIKRLELRLLLLADKLSNGKS